MIETSDGLPLMGELAKNQFVSTGYSGNGITFGTLGGMMAADAVLGQANPWAELFDTGRTKIRGGLWDYLRENKDYPYYLIRDRFAGAGGKSIRAVGRGSGRVLSLDGKHVAVYRDMDGSVVKFTTSGRVIGGPAESPLREP